MELLERMVHEYVGEMCRQVRLLADRWTHTHTRKARRHTTPSKMTEPLQTHPTQAYDVALMGQGEQPAVGQQAAAAAPPREVQTGDFIFLIRKDVRRYKRMKVRTGTTVWYG